MGIDDGNRRLTGWTPLTSLVRWMSMTSGRSFFRVEEAVEVVGWTRSVVDWMSFASGWAEKSSESVSMSSADTSSLELFVEFEDCLRFL